MQLKIWRGFNFCILRGKNGNQVLPTSRLRCFSDCYPEVTTKWSGVCKSANITSTEKFNWWGASYWHTDAAHSEAQRVLEAYHTHPHSGRLSLQNFATCLDSGVPDVPLQHSWKISSFGNWGNNGWRQTTQTEALQRLSLRTQSGDLLPDPAEPRTWGHTVDNTMLSNT